MVHLHPCHQPARFYLFYFERGIKMNKEKQIKRQQSGPNNICKVEIDSRKQLGSMHGRDLHSFNFVLVSFSHAFSPSSEKEGLKVKDRWFEGWCDAVFRRFKSYTRNGKKMGGVLGQVSCALGQN